jgi:hypothetical protein
MNIEEIIDFEPQTELGRKMKDMIENGDHSDAHFYWFIDSFEKQGIVFNGKYKEVQTLLKTLYNEMGSSADNDHLLWMKVKEYCFKNKLITYEK